MIDIIVDLRQNVLRLRLRERIPAVGQSTKVPAVLDIGEAGALLGLELRFRRPLALRLPNEVSLKPDSSESDYLALSDAATHLARSAEIETDVLTDAAGEIVEIVVPRCGSTYQISFPSGNQCWIPQRTQATTGRPLGWCAVMAE